MAGIFRGRLSRGSASKVDLDALGLVCRLLGIA